MTIRGARPEIDMAFLIAASPCAGTRGSPGAWRHVDRLAHWCFCGAVTSNASRAAAAQDDRGPVGMVSAAGALLIDGNVKLSGHHGK